MRVLITGGAGFIGSVVSEMCLAAGDEVVVYDNLATGHRESLHPDAEFVEGDVADRELLAATMKRRRTEAVIHMAGFIEAGESMKDPARYFSNNLCKPLGLLEAMVEAGVSRILFSSTAAVYGDPETELIAEDHPKRPTNAYGETKLQFERVLSWYDRIFGIKHVNLRYFNAAGASGERGEDHRPESHLIPLVLKTALGRRDSISIFGSDYPTADGTCIRDYIHIEDLAQAHIMSLKGLADRSLCYNLGNGKGYSVREVIDTARRVTGCDFRVVEEGRRPGDAAVLVASSDLIASELGWQPRHPELESIIQSAWEWHRAHPDGYGTG
ncbi:MAG: UDP-glucose 4-epimerase GalE [Gaiellales bacterium]|nr:MAG: UDP-glucose 4-epimerase GalE [Gaiellales bacterium]